MLGFVVVGIWVNFEVDVVVKYVEWLMWSVG